MRRQRKFTIPAGCGRFDRLGVSDDVCTLVGNETGYRANYPAGWPSMETMPRGASPKREREYNELKNRFKREHRYPGRTEEVAARIVNKQRREYGETKGEKAKDRAGKSPDRGLPISDYQHLTIPEVKSRLGRLSPPQLNRVKSYETGHKQRKGVLEEIRRRLR